MGGRRAMVSLVAALSALGAVAMAAPPASADGLPVGNVDTTRTGIAAPEGNARYFAVPARGATSVMRVDLDSGRIGSMLNLKGTFAIPGVALDGTTDGLSPDGRTLVLIEPRTSFPRKSTDLAILDAIDGERLRVRQRLTLDGDFSFDAVSPDGNLVYLIEYPDPGNPARYRVRGYDTAEERLLEKPIVDERVATEIMRGYPLTRATSPDGRWAYTLYDGGGRTPFVHALDTAEGQSVCIDLDHLAGTASLSSLGMAVEREGEELTVTDRRDRPRALIDTETWEVEVPEIESLATHPSNALPAGGAIEEASEEGGAPVVPLALVVVVALTGAAGVWWRRSGHTSNVATMPADPFPQAQRFDLAGEEPDATTADPIDPEEVRAPAGRAG